ncbi:hypothetical protein K8O68_09965 [Salipaludibacillus sp. CUR1]|nr:hypothetical protein [Salipaludibacillus sp. CUR1]MCE7792740.1 hypothetical protein [Salipaludibacillus sp. CUR1]
MKNKFTLALCCEKSVSSYYIDARIGIRNRGSANWSSKGSVCLASL